MRVGCARSVVLLRDWGDHEPVTQQELIVDREGGCVVVVIYRHRAAHGHAAEALVVIGRVEEWLQLGALLRELGKHPLAGRVHRRAVPRNLPATTPSEAV